ncbi:hypothetical protein SAMN04488074_1226 [Lentzea albidocapillata subsp. violacea]|uniref:Uncharacterized protein n=1 Tax=Lentzea albidocapillata subsp. violacea TaxID=128104 RepID=A0A1G9TG11_9PSEU|nr:hypothetical protein SAMN04488074_1226 [Lentzea albidocapillata subsp. violacea]
MDEGVTGGGVPTEAPGSGTGTESEVMVGIGSTADPVVDPTAATGAGSIAHRMPNHDRPTATVVTTAQATRYPTDRLTAAILL